MDWVKLATRYYDDQAVEQLDDAAEVMWTRGLARAGELERNGFIPDSSLPKLTRRRRYAASASELVAKGLWRRVDGGYQIVNWPRWNDALDELARRRAADRDRQRRRRERTRDQREPTMSRDNGQMSRDVTPTEGELEEEVLKGGDTGTAPRGRDSPPPRRCKKHINDQDPPNCGPCRDARLAAEQWQKDQVTRRVDADRRSRDSPHCGTCGNRTSSPYHRNNCRGSTP